MAKPNVVLIQSDQHRYDCMGANGHPFLRTPNLDRLAAEGVNFSHAFCPIPLCMPTRSSLLCGQWPAEHLHIANQDSEAPRVMRPGLPTFSELLRRDGYYLGYVGKWHVDPDRDPLQFGFCDYVPSWQYGSWREEQGLPPMPRTNRWFGETDPHVTPEQTRLAWGADRLIEMLEARAREGGPFFLRWDPPEPHLPNVLPEPYASMYPPGEILPWPSFGDAFEGKPYVQAQQLRTWQVDDWGWDEWAPIVGRYLGEVSLLDAQVGRVMDALDRLGLAADTLLIYTADHGDMCGAHGMIDKHFIMYDDVVRVPLVARWPGVVGAGRVCDDFVASSVDLAATFCEVAGLPVPDAFSGLSLLPLLRGEGSNGRPDIFASYHGNQFGLYSQRMVRDRRWKYVWNATAEDELYDLEADPAELSNLAREPGCAGELARLRRRLVEWMEETNDRLLNQWTRPQLLEELTR
jgi:arylsulfatase A-like enzyme